jgi:hypothetical protein
MSGWRPIPVATPVARGHTSAVARYVIAVSRDRASPGAPLLASIAGIQGLTIVGDANPHRLLVEATEDAIERVRSQFGTSVRIEPVILHSPS